jgi:hypothetical protein
MKRKRGKLPTALIIPFALELIGVVCTSAGIGVEISLKADWGYVMITGGALTVGLGGIIWGKFFKILN